MIGKKTIAKFLGKNNKAKTQPQKIDEAENNSRVENFNRAENVEQKTESQLEKLEKIEKPEKTIEDSGFVNIGGQYYEVNQNSPSVDIMKKSLSFVGFKKNYNNIMKVIEMLNDEKDALLMGGYSPTLLKDLEIIDSQIKNKTIELENILDKANSSFIDVIHFYLGSDVNLDNLGFVEIVELVAQCSKNNKYVKQNIAI